MMPGPCSAAPAAEPFGSAGPVGQQCPHPADGLECLRAVGLVGRDEAELAGAAIGRQVRLQEERHRRVAGSRGRDEEFVRSSLERLGQAAQLGGQPGRGLDGAGQGVGTLRRTIGRRLVGSEGTEQRAHVPAGACQALIRHVGVGRRECVQVAKRPLQGLHGRRVGQRRQAGQEVSAGPQPRDHDLQLVRGPKPVGDAAIAERCRQRANRPDALEVAQRLADAADLSEAGGRSKVHASACLEQDADGEQLTTVEVGGHGVEAAPRLGPRGQLLERVELDLQVGQGQQRHRQHRDDDGRHAARPTRDAGCQPVPGPGLVSLAFDDRVVAWPVEPAASQQGQRRRERQPGRQRDGHRDGQCRADGLDHAEAGGSHRGEAHDDGGRAGRDDGADASDGHDGSRFARAPPELLPEA